MALLTICFSLEPFTSLVSFLQVLVSALYLLLPSLLSSFPPNMNVDELILVNESLLSPQNKQKGLLYLWVGLFLPYQQNWSCLACQLLAVHVVVNISIDYQIRNIKQLLQTPCGL